MFNNEQVLSYIVTEIELIVRFGNNRFTIAITPDKKWSERSDGNVDEYENWHRNCSKPVMREDNIMRIHSSVRSGVAALAICCPVYSAMAQDQGAVTAVPQAASPAEEEVGLQEIVVTANRRAERLQNVPIAVNAIAGDAALRAGVTGTQDLAAAVPGLVITRNSNAAQPYLRGVGFTNGDPNAENSVALYVDGVYQPVTQGNFFSFNDLERIEVLKGPQGTLFGRNATGGVIQIITRTPSFDPEFEARIGYANYDTISGAVYGSTGLSETLAASVALQYENQRDGWGRNLTLDEEAFLGKSFSARGKILFTPSDRTRIVLAGDYHYARNTFASAQPARGLSGDPRNYEEQFGTSHPEVPVALFPGNPSVIPSLPAGSSYPGRYNTFNSTGALSTTRNRGVSLNIEQDFGAIQLRSITAYRRFSGQWNLDADYGPLVEIDVPLTQSAKTFSQEVHLYSPSEAKFQWLVGGYYFRHNAGYLPEIVNSFLFFAPTFDAQVMYNRSIATSFNLFAQGTYPLGDATNLTIGARYTWDKARYRSRMGFQLTGTSTVVPISDLSGTDSYDKPTWRIALDHRFAPDILGYVSYNRGIKSGNFSISVPVPEQALYKPEKLDAYEAGLKTEWFDRRLRVNLAAFYYEYGNKQFQKFVSGVTFTENADTIRYRGAELEIQARATPELTISANAAYLYSKIGNFENAPANYRGANGTNVDIPGYNAKGNRAPNAPSFSGNFTVGYEKETDIGTFNFTGNVTYTSKVYWQIDNRLEVDEHAQLNANLGWTDKSDRFSVTLWGKNLTNTYYYSLLIGSGGSGDAGTPEAPRTYGITLGYKM